MTAARWHLAKTWLRPLALAVLVFAAGVPSCMTARLWRDDARGLLGERREAGYEVQQRSPVELWWPESGAGSLRVLLSGDATQAGERCFELVPSAAGTFADLHEGVAVRVFAIDDEAGGRRWLVQPVGFAPVPPRGDLSDLALWIEAGSVPCTARPVDDPAARDRRGAPAELWRIRIDSGQGGGRNAVKCALTPVTVLIDIGGGVLWGLYYCLVPEYARNQVR